MGRELTEQALARGDRVAATLRTPSQLDDLVAVHGHRLWVRQLDVTDTMQMGRVVEEAFTDHERIDVVVSNAGFGVFGAAEDVTNDQLDRCDPPGSSGRLLPASAGWWSAHAGVQHGGPHGVPRLLALPCHQVGH